MTAARIGITGAAGGLGRHVVADLAAHGYRTVGADRVPAKDCVDWDGRSVEVLAEALAGCSGLVHLAAIPQPLTDPPEVVFGNNTTATFAALQAAARVGIGSVAIASSGSAYGTAFSPEPTHADYVPVDEQHPLRPADAYALSKEVDERIAAMFCRRYPMSVAALRFHWIADRRMQHEHDLLRPGAAQPAAPEMLRNLWGYVDVRDAARACRMAVEAGWRSPFGFAAMNIVAADTLSTVPVADLLATLAPGVDVRRPLGPTDGAYAIERAKAIIGWAPRHSWRDPDPLDG